MSWHHDFHRLLIEISDLTNRFDVDARLLAGAGVELDRALFPRLARIGLHGPISTVDLANLAGRDHSTVSRQVAKLEDLGLIERQPDPQDGRVRLLIPTPTGWDLLSQVDSMRCGWMEDHFRDWPIADRDCLLELMSRMMQGLRKA